MLGLPEDILGASFKEGKLNYKIVNLEEMVLTDQSIKRELGMQTPKEKFLDKVKDLSKEELIKYIQNDIQN